MANPKISILLPTYNRASLLNRAAKSILAQSFQNWELVIVNDASTDGTKKFLNELAGQDPRVRPVHHEKNYYPDISRTLNEGLQIARGEYVARLDDDDYWCDDRKLEKQATFLDAHSDIAIAGGGTIVIDENDHEKFRYLKPEQDGAIRDKALFANPFTHSTVIFRRQMAIEAGGYGDFKNAEDWDLWLRLGTHGKFYNFQEYFTRYTMTEQSKTFVFKRSQSKEILRLIAAHKKEYPHFNAAYALNLAQYGYSLLPFGIQRLLYRTLSKAKRSAFGN